MHERRLPNGDVVLAPDPSPDDLVRRGDVVAWLNARADMTQEAADECTSDSLTLLLYGWSHNLYLAARDFAEARS